MQPQPQPSDLQGFFREIFQAVQSQNWRYVAALAIIALVFVTRKYGQKLVPALAQGKWAWALTVAMGALGALGSALAANQVHGVVDALSILASGAFVGAGAGGLYKGMSEWKPTKTPNGSSPPPSPPSS